METKEIEFSKLKHAYITIKQFLEKESGGKVTSLDSKVETDLGLSGDDNLELLEKFVNKFELDYKSFEYDKHFYSEEELFGLGRAVVSLLTLSVWLPLKTIELLTFNKVNIDKPKFPVLPDREVSDLTFKELITWYIEKDYIPVEKIKYRIKKES